jgi:chromosome segregation ATPase
MPLWYSCRVGTFNSQELQELVSRAIRLTARESFIRLLSLENLDRALPAEAERLSASKSATQSKYRFLVHRRTMLLQAINSSAETSSSTNNNANKNDDAVSQLVVQLAQTTAECDRVLEELLLHSDQLAQIEQTINLHWASALAVALRKVRFWFLVESCIILISATAAE